MQIDLLRRLTPSGLPTSDTIKELSQSGCRGKCSLEIMPVPIVRNDGRATDFRAVYTRSVGRPAKFG